MQKKRCRKLGMMRRVLTCAIALISLVALFSAHLHIFFPPSHAVSMLPDPYNLPTKREIRYQKLSKERSWIRPHLSKAPLPARKLDGANGSLDSSKLWKPPPNRDFVPCVDPSSSYIGPQETRGYLLVHTNGGLNQMRAGICDMVAVARIINATLVVPELDKRSFWQDTSNFSDVFDEDYFITSLANDVKIIKKLPKELLTATRTVKHFRSWSGIDYYKQEIASLWDDYQVEMPWNDKKPFTTKD